MRKDSASVIEITTKIGCKIACAYCPQEKVIRIYTERSKITQFSFDVFKACADKIPLNVNVIFAGMCEPFLNPECTKMILYAHKKGHKISVDTTLVGMELSDIDLLESIPFNYFCVHLPSSEGGEKIEVDDNYLKLLTKISKSNINASFHFHGQAVDPKVKLLIKDAFSSYTSTRAGNVKIKDWPLPNRQKGVMGCKRNLRWNVLLPNGDVILCSLDYGMHHVIGNLLSSDYASLFRSQEFLKIKKGLKNESLDILCRYCDMYSYDPSLLKRVYRSLSSWFKKIKRGV